MSYTRFKSATFGPGKVGLATVGYTLTGGSRITAGVAEIGTSTGSYGATVTFTDSFAGSILWDTGDSPVAYAAEEINPDFTATQKTSIGAAVAASNVAGVTGVTFPATVASPTNITAGTITTVTNLTNAPTSGDLTATMKASVTTACTASTPTAAAVTGAVGSVTGLTAATIATAVLTTQMTESYNVDGTAPTLAQAQFVQMQRLTEFSVGSTTITVKKLDGTTTAYTLTMDAAASSATSSTRGS